MYVLLKNDIHNHFEIKKFCYTKTTTRNNWHWYGNQFCYWSCNRSIRHANNDHSSNSLTLTFRLKSKKKNYIMMLTLQDKFIMDSWYELESIDIKIKPPLLAGVGITAGCIV